MNSNSNDSPIFFLLFLTDELRVLDSQFAFIHLDLKRFNRAQPLSYKLCAHWTVGAEVSNEGAMQPVFQFTYTCWGSLGLFMYAFIFYLLNKFSPSVAQKKKSYQEINTSPKHNSFQSRLSNTIKHCSVSLHFNSYIVVCLLKKKKKLLKTSSEN